MITLSRIKLLLAFILLFLNTLASGEQLDSFKPPYFATSNVTPWGYVNKAGLPTGLLVDYTQLLSQETGLPVNIQIRPYPRVIHEIESGLADFAFMFKSSQSDEIAESLGEAMTINVILVSLADHPPIERLSDMKGKRIGFIRGSKYGEIFDDADYISKEPLTNMDIGLKMLQAKRLNAIACVDQTLYFSMNKLKINPEKLELLLQLSTTKANLYISKKSKYSHVKAKFSKAIREIRHSDDYDRIFNQFSFTKKEYR